MEIKNTVQSFANNDISILIAGDKFNDSIGDGMVNIMTNTIDINTTGNGSHEKLEALQKTLITLGYPIKGVISNQTRLSEQCIAHQAELLIVNTEVLTTELLKEIIFVEQLSPLPVLIIAKQATSASISQSIANRSAAYLVNSTEMQDLPTCIAIASAQFNIRQTRRDAIEQTKKQLKDRKLITQAAGYLMAQKRVNEEQALKSLKQMAMKNGQSLTITANNVVSVCSLLKQHCNE